jgi:hypothetical protein
MAFCRSLGVPDIEEYMFRSDTRNEPLASTHEHS